MIAIARATFPDDGPAVLAIWREYVASPRTSLAYQDNEREFATLPGKYAPPLGGVFLARRTMSGPVRQYEDRTALGCVAFRPVDGRICEMKRLYVRPQARGLALGRKLAEAAIAAARDAGYDEMRLDVLEEFTAAQALYAALGFVDAEPVSYNPVPGARFLGLAL